MDRNPSKAHLTLDCLQIHELIQSMAMEIIHEEFRQNHRRLWISSEDCDVLNVNKVENLIERCLQLYMNKDEVVKTLLNRVRIDPGFTTLGTNAAPASTSESGSKMMISREAFESLSQKVEESERLAGMKVEAAMAQIEAVGASEKEALKWSEATQKEINEL